MSEIRITAQRGETIDFQLTATKPDDDGVDQPVDLTAAGTKLIVTGKLHVEDDPVFVKDYYQAGGSPNGGITVGAPNPTNVADILIAGDEPGLSILTKTAYVLVDAILIEPNGHETKVAGGVIKLRVGPGS